jgi:hypothetical protein
VVTLLREFLLMNQIQVITRKNNESPQRIALINRTTTIKIVFATISSLQNGWDLGQTRNMHS